MINQQPSRTDAIKVALATLQSQGGRPKRATVEALVDALLAGEAPKNYAERFVQMALQQAALLPTPPTTPLVKA